MVVEKLEDTLRKHYSGLDAYLQNFETYKSGKAAVDAEAQATLEKAEAHDVSCKGLLGSAKVDRDTAEQDVKNAKSAVADQEKELKEAKTAEGSKEQGLGTANDNLAAFKFLYERVKAVPESA